jgi:hypothetical protein
MISAIGKRPMNPRDKLQKAYEIAFFPPAIHKLWTNIKNDRIEIDNELRELIDMALSLHQALPESGYASQRALKRLAMYQADARAFGTVTFLRNIRRYAGITKPFEITMVPSAMVRDIGLPPFTHHNIGDFSA